jgi:DNA replication and repair protein RecF
LENPLRFRKYLRKRIFIAGNAMFVRHVRLENFRNYASQDVPLAPGLVAFTGDNGQGKTNLLEALCVLATTKSPLVERDRELLRWGSEVTRLDASVQLSAGRGQARRLSFEWREHNGTLVREGKVGGVPQSALAQWLGLLQVVAFFPHDLALVAGEPEGRRRFLNLELGKTRAAHFADAARYRRALAQRNALLKFFIDRKSAARRYARRVSSAGALGVDASTSVAPNGGFGTLSEWNRQVTSYGARIWAQRAEFLRELEPLLSSVHRDLSGLETPLSIEYLPGLSPNLRPGQDEDEAVWSRLFARALEDDHEDDLRRGTTTSGPHRDDLAFRLGEMDLRRFGSQGQQRLAVLSLKIALAQWVRQATGESPILLLDDALSELDATRRERVLRLASGFEQAIITATDDSFLHNVSAQSFSIQAGEVTERLQPAEPAQPAPAETSPEFSLRT